MTECHDVLRCSSIGKSNPTHAHEGVMVDPEDIDNSGFLSLVICIDADGARLVLSEPSRAPSGLDRSLFLCWVEEDFDVTRLIVGEGAIIINRRLVDGTLGPSPNLMIISNVSNPVQRDVSRPYTSHLLVSVGKLYSGFPRISMNRFSIIS